MTGITATILSGKIRDLELGWVFVELILQQSLVLLKCMQGRWNREYRAGSNLPPPHILAEKEATILSGKIRNLELGWVFVELVLQQSLILLKCMQSRWNRGHRAGSNLPPPHILAEIEATILSGKIRDLDSRTWTSLCWTHLAAELHPSQMYVEPLEQGAQGRVQYS